jgi:phosphonate metabolism protein (transferase hexapeptide repeat family)
MQAVTTIGLDIAKSVFQVHGIDAAGNVIIRRQFKRRYVLAFFQKLPPCVVGIEACTTSHHWSRELKGRASQHHFTYRSCSHHLADEDDPEIFAWRRAHPVRIGPDVWIGHGAIILPGVSVGAGAVIGAGAVVTHDVAGYTIVAGVPARPVRRRFTEAVEAALLRIAWWDWPRESVAAALQDFRTLDGEAFAAKYDRDL